MTYTYHSTPQASMYAMLISGWHKSQGHNVVFTDEPPNCKLYDTVYIIKDRIGVGHVNSWLTPDNVIPVGNYWERDGVEAYYNTDWETTPPDNTIYWGWLDRWTTKYQKYNKQRLEHFYRTPIKIKQKDKIVWPSGSNLFILDNDMEQWDPEFEGFLQQSIIGGRLAYPIKIDGRWETTLEFLAGRQLEREYLFVDLYFENYTDEDFKEAAAIWAKYKLGRMIRLRLNVECYTNEEWVAAIPRIYKALAEFRMQGKKMLRVQPFTIEAFDYPRILTEMKRWTGRSIGYAKNSLFDYIVFDGIRNTNLISLFFTDPYSYIQKKKFGSNKLEEVLNFAEAYPDLFYVITESYTKGGT